MRSIYLLALVSMVGFVGCNNDSMRLGTVTPLVKEAPAPNASNQSGSVSSSSLSQPSSSSQSSSSSSSSSSSPSSSDSGSSSSSDSGSTTSPSSGSSPSMSPGNSGSGDHSSGNNSGGNSSNPPGSEPPSHSGSSNPPVQSPAPQDCSLSLKIWAELAGNCVGRSPLACADYQYIMSFPVSDVPLSPQNLQLLHSKIASMLGAGSGWGNVNVTLAICDDSSCEAPIFVRAVDLVNKHVYIQQSGCSAKLFQSGK